MIKLFPDEKIIINSDSDKVILTTHRICYEYKEWGRSYNQSIMLEHITSCENHNIKRNWLLIIAGLLLIFGLFGASQGSIQVLGLFGLIAIGVFGLYWITRQNSIIIGSPSTKMLINVTRMRRESVLSFINDIEQAKHKRVLTMSTKN